VRPKLLLLLLMSSKSLSSLLVVSMLYSGCKLLLVLLLLLVAGSGSSSCCFVPASRRCSCAVQVCSCRTYKGASAAQDGNTTKLSATPQKIVIALAQHDELVQGYHQAW
jgi:hypothetical protein